MKKIFYLLLNLLFVNMSFAEVIYWNNWNNWQNQPIDTAAFVKQLKMSAAQEFLNNTLIESKMLNNLNGFILETIYKRGAKRFAIITHKLRNSRDKFKAITKEEKENFLFVINSEIEKENLEYNNFLSVDNALTLAVGGGIAAGSAAIVAKCVRDLSYGNHSPFGGVTRIWGAAIFSLTAVASTAVTYKFLSKTKELKNIKNLEAIREMLNSFS